MTNAPAMFRIKICGITTIDDALLATEAGTDAVGLNFFPGSPRCIDFERARQIVAALPGHSVKVGLFVNEDAATVCRSFDELGLDLIQLHGDEPAEFLAKLGSRPVMRAFRLAENGLAHVRQYLHQCENLRCVPKRVLLDAYTPDRYGGSGKTADWSLAAEYARDKGLPPLVLAGGLTPENVAEAIQSTLTSGVDTASGVESQPGRKSAELVQQFVAEARRGFAEISNPKSEI